MVLTNHRPLKQAALIATQSGYRQLKTAIGIGKIVFRTLNRIEIVFALLMLAALYIQRPEGNFALYIFGAIFVLLALQTFWLLPQLNARTEQLIEGSAAPHSNNHIIFIVFETIKFLLLSVLGVSLLTQNLRLE